MQKEMKVGGIIISLFPSVHFMQNDSANRKADILQHVISFLIG